MCRWCSLLAYVSGCCGWVERWPGHSGSRRCRVSYRIQEVWTSVLACSFIILAVLHSAADGPTCERCLLWAIIMFGISYHAEWKRSRMAEQEEAGGE